MIRLNHMDSSCSSFAQLTAARPYSRKNSSARDVMYGLKAMSDTDQKQDDTYSEAETVARREAALKRAFATPHKPHKAQGKRTNVKDSHDR